MSERQKTITAFLNANQWDGVAPTPLAGDASFRRYLRLNANGQKTILMDAAPPQENVIPFSRMARHLISLGLKAPKIYAEDVKNGLLLLEDLGDDTYSRMLAKGADERTLYRLAVDVLIHIHRLSPTTAIPEWLKSYDDEKLLNEAQLFCHWYMPKVFAKPTDEAIHNEYAKAWLAVLPVIHRQSSVLLLRDYHVDNLMWLPNNHGLEVCGLLDFQDAVSGPAAYDLMSLLEDARRDIAKELVDDMLEHYLAAFPDLERDDFRTSFTVLAAQRHAKVIGIFTRLCVRDAKTDYLVHLPRVWRLLECALEHPALKPVADWFNKYIPRDKRTCLK